jgi:hypothetical protein
VHVRRCPRNKRTTNQPGWPIALRASDVRVGLSLFSLFDSVNSPFATPTQPSTTTSTMSVRVVARIRPLLKHELDKDTIVTAESESPEGNADPTIVRIPNPKNESESFSFQFSSVYEQDATQQQIFDSEGPCR